MFIQMEKAARKLRVHRLTIHRLEKAGKIGPIPRDRNGHRLFTPELIEELRETLFPEQFSSKKK